MAIVFTLALEIAARKVQVNLQGLKLSDTSFTATRMVLIYWRKNILYR